MKSSCLLVAIFCTAVQAFSGPLPRWNVYEGYQSSTACKATVSSETLAQIGYTVSVSKPLGVVFGENRAPYFGLVVDDVEPGQNGGKAGLKVGDQLLSVDGKPVVGKDFDTVMNILRSSPDPLELDLYRGPVSQLFTIIMNLKDKGDSEDDVEFDEDIPVMDDSYESPVQIDLSDYEEQSLSESASNVVKNLGNIFGGSRDESAKKGGLFGSLFSKETIQLEGDDGK